MSLWVCADLGWGLLVEHFQSKTLQLLLSSALAIHLPESFVHPHSIKLIVTRTQALSSNMSSLCTNGTFCFFGMKSDLWLVLMLQFSGAPFNVDYALRFFLYLITVICSFLSQTKHVLGQQPLKGLDIVICKCGSNSVIASFHNSHQCSSVNKQAAVRHMMGARSNLATRVYHQDKKHPGAGELSPLPAYDSLTAGEIDGALFFTDKIFLFVEPWCFLWSQCWMQTTWKSCADAVPKRHGASVYAGRVQQETKDTCTVILCRFWFGCCVLRGICKAL